MLGWAQTPAVRPVYASDFSRWVEHSSSSIPGPGSFSIMLESGSVVASGGEIVPVPEAGEPLLVDSGSAAETVTAQVTLCPDGTRRCFTATFAHPHSGRYPVRSGSGGLAEAIEYAATARTQVILDASWTGSDSMLATVPGSAQVLLLDERGGSRAWLGWNGGAYVPQWTVTSGASGPQVGSARPQNLFPDFAQPDNAPWNVAATANAELSTSGGVSSAGRFSLYALSGGNYNAIQPTYPVLNAEALCRTRGQCGGLFSYNLMYGTGNGQGASSITKCWGGTSTNLQGGSLPLCSGTGEEDAVEGDVATVVTLAQAVTPRSTEAAYIPIANEQVAGAREWFDISQAEFSGDGTPSGCGISSESGTGWFLTGSGCPGSATLATWAGRYIVPNTTHFWYPASSGACDSASSDYTADGIHCMGVPYYIASSTGASQLNTVYPLDSVGVVDMYAHNALPGQCSRVSMHVTCALTDAPNLPVGTNIGVSCPSDPNFNANVTLTQAGASAVVDSQVSYDQPGSAPDAITTGSCTLQHAPIPFVIVDGLQIQDVDIVNHEISFPAGSAKTWSAGDTLVSPPSPWTQTLGQNFVIYKNHPLQRGQDANGPIFEGLRIRNAGPARMDYGLEFAPPVSGSGGWSTLFKLDAGTPTGRGLDLQDQDLSDCVLCIRASSDGSSNKIKWASLSSQTAMGTANLFFDGKLELQGPAAGSVRISDTSGLSSWTFLHGAGTVSIQNGAGQPVLTDKQGTIQVGSANGVELGNGNGTAITAHYSFTASLTPAPPATTPGCSDTVVAVTAALGANDTVNLGLPAVPPASAVAEAFVSGAHQITVRWCELAGAAVAPPAGLYRVDDWQH